jgi:hypothetical protein
VDPRAGLDFMEMREMSSPCRECNPGRPSGRLFPMPTELFRLHIILHRCINYLLVLLC